MATPTLVGKNTDSDSIIAGYFDNGEDAHRAINALLDEGFLATQIGAAFHTGPDISGPSEQGGSSREELGTTLSPGTTSSDASSRAPASDTSAVQPGALIGGSGTIFEGAGKPGPISGSSLEHTGLPSELQHELPHDTPGSSIGHARPVSVVAPATDGEPSGSKSHHATGSWSSKIKHLFESKHTPDTTPSAPVDKTSQNFGTGEGHLQLDPVYDRPYSQSEFESTATKFGVPAEQSRHLSHRLGQGGAVVTVNVTGRAIEVEKIFEQHHGQVRLEGGLFGTAVSPASEQRIEVFGPLGHVYPRSE